jgi:hypothetical protein
MFLARAAAHHISAIFATPAVASAPASVLGSSRHSTREHSNRVRFTHDVEVKEFARVENVKCGFRIPGHRGCNLDYHHCQCLRKQTYNSGMKATFVSIDSQIASELPYSKSDRLTRRAEFKANISYNAQAKNILSKWKSSSDCLAPERQQAIKCKNSLVIACPEPKDLTAFEGAVLADIAATVARRKRSSRMLKVGLCCCSFVLSVMSMKC